MTEPELNALLEKIAAKHLGFETLEDRRSDRLDCRDCKASCVKEALLEAFKAGVAVGTAL
jgi:hypothetical protein